MNKYLISLIAILLVSCMPNADVQIVPEKLPDAYINQPYKARINIIDSEVDDADFYWEVSESSFKIIPDAVYYFGSYDYENLTLIGKPQSLEPVKVTIAGSTLDRKIFGNKFKKTYIINVKVADED